MSSETPGDRPSASPDTSAEARPRRALESGDEQPTENRDQPSLPESPSTPVRFGDRLASRRHRLGGRPGPESDDQWTWDVPEAVQAHQPEPSGPDAAAAGEPTVPGAANAALDVGRTGAARDPGATDEPAEPDTVPTDPRSGPPRTDDSRSDQGDAKDAGRKQATPAAPGKQRFKLLQGVAPRAPRESIPDQSHLPADQRTDLAVRITDLSITYRTSFEKKPTLRQAIVRMGRGQRAVREIKALQHVSFEVKTGSSVGIIGRNGAGKSTLMRAMAGILPPTSGTIEVWGRASTLLALGVGFNNALSGRENIVLGGLAAGLGLEEVAERANEVAEWTELGDFIDMPMRTYSSGMAARVAFGVAVHMEPDILMIDEGLSTGDAHFRDKASAKMTELRDKARAMFLVSHGLGSIKELCDEAIWIDKGQLRARGEPEEVIDQYLTHLKSKPKATAFEDL